MNITYSRIFLASLVCTLSGSLNAQQWSGSSTTSGNIGRTGSVGIGTTSPTSRLDVVQDGSAAILQVRGFRSGTGNAAFFRGLTARGSFASPSALISGDVVATFMGQGYDGSNFSSAGRLRFIVDGTVSAGKVPTKADFLLPDSAGVEKTRMTIKSDGFVGIGTTGPGRKLTVYHDSGSTYSSVAKFETPTSLMDFTDVKFSFDSNITSGATHFYLEDQDNSDARYLIEGLGGGGTVDAFFVTSSGKMGIGIEPSGSYVLEANGTIRAKEIVVESTGWSDFVFENDYQLATLDEVSSFIEVNGHLPDIPSAEDVAENGITLGEMNAKLLQKVEELTLYAMEQQEQIQNQERRLDEQSLRLRALEKQLTHTTHD